MLLWTGCNNPLCGLTPRKRALIEVLATHPAATNGELAERLHISESTVKKHLREIYQVVGAQSRSECLLLLLQKGLITSVDEKIVALPKRGDYGQQSA
jgi:DNA-binding CsgD family transcriptional regulator